MSEFLVALEPMVRAYDEIEFLDAVMEIKRSQVSGVVSPAANECNRIPSCCLIKHDKYLKSNIYTLIHKLTCNFSFSLPFLFSVVW